MRTLRTDPNSKALTNPTRYPPSSSLDADARKERRRIRNAGKMLRRLHRSAGYRRELRARAAGECLDGVLAIKGVVHKRVGHGSHRGRESLKKAIARPKVGWRRFGALVRFLKALSRPRKIVVSSDWPPQATDPRVDIERMR